MRRRNLYADTVKLPISQTSDGQSLPLLVTDMTLRPKTAYVISVHLDASCASPNPVIQAASDAVFTTTFAMAQCADGEQVIEVPFTTTAAGDCCIKLRSIAVKDATIIFRDAFLETKQMHDLASGGGLPGFFTKDTAAY